MSDRLLRASIWLVVVAIAGFTAQQSYSHIYDLGLAHGQSGLAARFLPLSIDGVILAASLLMLEQARADRPGGPLPRIMLVAGIVVTLWANIVYGLRGGLTGAILDACSPLGFVGIVEAVIGDVRRAAKPGRGRHAGQLPAAAPGDAETAAAAALRASIAGGNPLSQNQLADRFKLTRTQVRQLVDDVARESNGQPAAGVRK